MNVYSFNYNGVNMFKQTVRIVAYVLLQSDSVTCTHAVNCQSSKTQFDIFSYQYIFGKAQLFRENLFIYYNDIKGQVGTYESH